MASTAYASEWMQFEQDMNAYDFYNPARQSTNYVMLNFFNNHDQWRMSVSAPGDAFRKVRVWQAPSSRSGRGFLFSITAMSRGWRRSGPPSIGTSREDFMTSKALSFWNQPSKHTVGGFQPGSFR